MKSFSADQIQKYERDPEPLYFVHISLPGETLYFSDRNFAFNGHNYEDYLLDIPETLHSIERFGGYLNLNAQLTFRNQSFRSYNKLFDFLLQNPITKREMDIYVLYIQDHVIPGFDVSTKLHRVAFGEPKTIKGDFFDFELFSILHTLDSKKLFTQINRANWPNAAPQAIGQYENRLIGAVRGIPCPCVDTGATSTLYTNLTDIATEIYLSDVEFPLSFPFPGTIQINEEKMTYTGKDSINKKLTGLTRGVSSTLVANHKAGDVVWVIQNSYKYLADIGQMKSISDVYISQTRINPSDYTINLNDNGKSTIAMTKKALNKHGHGQKSTYEMHPVSASHQDIVGTITWQGYDVSMYDLYDSTWQRFAYSGVIPEQKCGDFILNFPSYNGDAPDAVYVVAVVKCNFTGSFGEYFRLQTPEQIDIGDTNTQITVRLKLSTTTVPTQVKIRGNTNHAVSGGFAEFDVAEVWLEVERWASNPSGSADEVLAPLVTIDGEGYADDGSGTYTGVANALIENPSDARKYILMALLGRTSADIGSSFGDMRTIYNGRIVPYKLAMNLPKVGLIASEIFKRLDEQTRSQMREDGGKFELSFHPGPNGAYGSDFLPSDGTGITASGYYVTYYPSNSCDNSNSTYWHGRVATFPEWVQHDAGAGITHIARKLTIKTDLLDGHARAKDFSLSGSNNGTTWTVLCIGQQADNNNVQSYAFTNFTPYRYYRLVVINSWADMANAVTVVEWELMEVIWSAPSDPTPVMTIDKTIFIGEPVFKMTPSVEIKNVLRASFDLDHGNNGERKKFGDYFEQIEIPDSTSITKYGELPEELTFPAVRDADMVKDVLQWKLTQEKDLIPIVEIACNRLVRKLERDDYFTLIDCPVADWEGDLWRVLDVREIPELQKFEISAIKFIGS